MQSFQDFERSFHQELYQQPDKIDEQLASGVNQTNASIRKLCRICTSNGLISIQTTMNRCNLKFKPSGDQGSWDIPISQIIAKISGEEVSPEDALPQFICEHCLGYLQHAYQLRLKILANSANLRFAKEIAEDNSVFLEETQMNQSLVTKREIDDWNEDTNEESHFFNKFHGANIRINQGPKKRVERIIEHKCPSCKKRVMSIKSLNDHMEICEIRVIDAFFSQIQSIFSMRFAIKLTTNEFILYAIKLVFEIHQKLLKIVKRNNIDVAAISSDIPTENINNFTQPIPFSFNIKRDHQSPDNGYLSGGNSNFMLR